MHRSGEFENFIYRLMEMGEGLTLRTFSETKLTFLSDTLENIDDLEDRVSQCLKIASVLMDLARWNESETQLRQALAEAQAHANAKLVALASINLAKLLKDTNRFEEAGPLTRQALEIDKAAFGKRHHTVARDSSDLAHLLQATNRLKEAEPMMQRALEIGDAAFGKRHPIVSVYLNNLSVLLQITNQLREAEPLMRRALEIAEATLDNQHPSVATCLNNLGQLLQDTNRLDEAEPLMRRVLEIDKAVFGEQHPAVARDLNNLATLLQGTNRLEEANPLLRRALEILDSCGRQARHKQPHFKTVKANYKALQRAMGLDELD